MKARAPERGSITLMALLWTTALVGMAALAVDAVRMWIVHQELRTAAQACALAAVVEIDGSPDAAARAAVIGAMVGGQRNRKALQSEPVGIVPQDVSFGASAQGPWLSDASPASARATHVRCTAKEPSLALALGGILGLPQTAVHAQAIAGLAPGQTSCPLPLALCAGSVGSASTTFGLLKGQLLRADLSALGFSGVFRWVNVNSVSGGTGLEPLKAPLVGRGTCGTSVATQHCIGTETGQIASLTDEWNTRFGLYRTGQGAYSPDEAPPAFSGRGYDSRWCQSLSSQEALSLDILQTVGAAISLCHSLTDRYRPIDEPARAPHEGNLSGFRVDAQAHVTLGRPGRRLAVVPVVDCGAGGAQRCGSRAAPVVGWACVFLRAAIRTNGTPEVEFVGRADDPLTGCRGFGMPGRFDGGGPLVAALVD